MNIFDVIKNNKKVIGIILIVIVGFIVYKFTLKRVILFYSESCGHCQKFKPEWERIKQNGTMNTSEYNCGESPMSCNAYGIQGYPTIIVENGFSSHEYHGERTLEQILNFYNNN